MAALQLEKAVSVPRGGRPSRASVKSLILFWERHDGVEEWTNQSPKGRHRRRKKGQRATAPATEEPPARAKLPTVCADLPPLKLDPVLHQAGKARLVELQQATADVETAIAEGTAAALSLAMDRAFIAARLDDDELYRRASAALASLDPEMAHPQALKQALEAAMEGREAAALDIALEAARAYNSISALSAAAKEELLDLAAAQALADQLAAARTLAAATQQAKARQLGLARLEAALAAALAAGVAGDAALAVEARVQIGAMRDASAVLRDAVASGALGALSVALLRAKKVGVEDSLMAEAMRALQELEAGSLLEDLRAAVRQHDFMLMSSLSLNARHAGLDDPAVAEAERLLAKLVRVEARADFLDNETLGAPFGLCLGAHRAGVFGASCLAVVSMHVASLLASSLLTVCAAFSGGGRRWREEPGLKLVYVAVRVCRGLLSHPSGLSVSHASQHHLRARQAPCTGPTTLVSDSRSRVASRRRFGSRWRRSTTPSTSSDSTSCRTSPPSRAAPRRCRPAAWCTPPRRTP